MIPRLVGRGYRVRAVVREESRSKVLPGAEILVGDVRSRASVAPLLPKDSIVVHLVGTPKPSPAKAAQFEALDFVAARECLAASVSAGVSHFVYVSVAQPAPVMRAYVDVRRRVEAELGRAGLPHTIVRPWYVLGPGHRWPYLLVPMYWALGALPSTREGAARLGLVTLRQMLETLVWSVDNASADMRILDVPDIKRIASARSKTTA